MCAVQIDIFSLGVLLLEMVTGEIPQPFQMREQQPCPAAAPECQADVADLIQECCASDPKKRPSAELVYVRLTAW